MLIASVAVYNGAAFTAIDTALLIQAAMLVAGIGTLIQLYPVWRIGSRLPLVMGLSFTFLSAMMTLAAKDYGLMIGAVIVGGCVEGLLGLSAKYWRRFVSPIVSACVVTTIGFSLLSTGISSFASSSVYPTGAWQNLLVAVITLAACLVYNSLAKGFWKQLYVLFGLIVGYVVSLFFGMVDFASMKATVQELGVIALPRLFAYTPKFELGAIVSVTLVFLVSAAETIGDTSAVCTGGLGREITEKEVSGSLACDGFISAVSGGVFGCPPITSFSQNVGLVAMTKVVNRFTIMFGALTLILAGLFPPVGAFFSTLPDCVLGGCTVIMFGAIIVSGVTMLGECGFDQRNTIIAATSFAIGIGVTQVPEFFSGMPQLVYFCEQPCRRRVRCGNGAVADASEKDQGGGCRRADRRNHGIFQTGTGISNQKTQVRFSVPAFCHIPISLCPAAPPHKARCGGVLSVWRRALPRPFWKAPFPSPRAQAPRPHPA